MLDIHFIRENRDLVKSAAERKGFPVDIDRLLQIDGERKELNQEIEQLRAEQNRQGETLQTASDNGRELLLLEMKDIKNKIQKLTDQLKPLDQEFNDLILIVPNVPDVSIPDGSDDSQNKEIRSWGEKTLFDFIPQDHMALLADLGMVDFERGTKVHGFRGYFLTGQAVKLCFAIWNYALDFFHEKGFQPLITPSIVREDNLFGTGHLPTDADDSYKTQDNDYLIGTSEISLMGMYSDEVLDSTTFPIKMLGFSPCFRREAGSYGKDTKGLIRVNEFFKWEQVMLCEASHEESEKWHEWINRNTEEFIESLGIPYRTVLNCAGDLGLGQVKKYDIELWVPGEEKYREISSASYFHDFQTRRFNIRYRDADGKMCFAHSLNCTAIPTPRLLVAFAENFQNQAGEILIPEKLQSYFGKDKITKS